MIHPKIIKAINNQEILIEYYQTTVMYNNQINMYIMGIIMYRIQESEIIPISNDNTWDLMRDLDLRPQWDSTVSHVSRDEQFLYYTAPLISGFSWHWIGEYITFEPPTRSAVKMISGSLHRPFANLIGSWILKPHGSETLLTMNISFEPRLNLPFLPAIMGRRIRRLTVESMSKLASLAANQ